MESFVDTEALLQLGLAIVYGGAVGLERERRGRAAGLRTLILVCLGSTLIMIVSANMPSNSGNGSLDPAITRVDPSRIAAGIVTGVGFLGAAVVIRLGDLIRGVTTAAAIWFTAGLGIAIGSGAYGLATAATIGSLIVLWSFNRVDRLVRAPVYRVVELQLGNADPGAVEKPARNVLEGYGARVMDLRSAIDLENDSSELRFHIRAKQDFGSPEILRELGKLDAVRSVAWK